MVPTFDVYNLTHYAVSAPKGKGEMWKKTETFLIRNLSVFKLNFISLADIKQCPSEKFIGFVYTIVDFGLRSTLVS